MWEGDEGDAKARSDARSLEEIAQRLVEMQQELDAREPVDPEREDEPPAPDDA